jgi:hypothetical protein
MASGTAASVKLCATGLQRPGVLTVRIELMSVCGTNRTNRAGLTISVDRGKLEAAFRGVRTVVGPKLSFNQIDKASQNRAD